MCNKTQHTNRLVGVLHLVHTLYTQSLLWMEKFMLNMSEIRYTVWEVICCFSNVFLNLVNSVGLGEGHQAIQRKSSCISWGVFYSVGYHSNLRKVDRSGMNHIQVQARCSTIPYIKDMIWCSMIRYTNNSKAAPSKTRTLSRNLKQQRLTVVQDTSRLSLQSFARSRC